MVCNSEGLGLASDKVLTQALRRRPARHGRRTGT
jgi:hypothetical protein